MTSAVWEFTPLYSIYFPQWAYLYTIASLVTVEELG